MNISNTRYSRHPSNSENRRRKNSEGQVSIPNMLFQRSKASQNEDNFVNLNQMKSIKSKRISQDLNINLDLLPVKEAINKKTQKLRSTNVTSRLAKDQFVFKDANGRRVEKPKSSHQTPIRRQNFQFLKLEHYSNEVKPDLKCSTE